MAKKVYDEKINKSTDWGGDDSTGNLPVAGSRVQEFIKEQLEEKAGVFYYDTANNRYIVFADAESRDAYLDDPTKTDLIIGTFDAPFNYSAEITLSTPTYVAILAETKNNYIDFTFDTKNKNSQSVGEAVIVTYTFIKAGIKKTVTEKYQYGASVHFKIDDYISIGTNTITVGVVGQNTLAATTVGLTYQVVDLQLTDTYDISQSYNLISNPAATAAIPYAVSGYGTKTMEWHLDGKLLDYVKVEDEIVDVSTTRTKYISLANLAQGIHTLQYRAYTMVDGEKFYSNILYRDLIVLTGANKNPIIAVSAVIPVGNDIVTSENLQLYGITQYIPYELRFAVYNPSSVASTDTMISVDAKNEAAIQTHNGEIVSYSLRPTTYGVKTLTISSGTTERTIGLNISKSSTSLEPIINALQLDLTALGRSNNDINKEEWVYGDYSTVFDGFNWNMTSGWNNNRLLITSGAYVDINLSPLTPDPTTTGKTLEFEFATSNVNDDNAVICDLRNDSGTGILITASEVKLKSAGGAEVSTKFKSEENIRVAFVVNRKTGVTNKGLVFIYVNGICCGAVNYASTDNFTSDKMIRIGGTQQADVELKALRFYNAALSSDQVLNNYMLYRDTTSEMLSIYDKNNVYEEGTQNFSVDKLAAQCPVMIFTGDIPTLENTTDKNETIYVDVEYINMQEPARSFKSQGTRLRPQGTSSMGYPKKNFRPYTNYGTMWDNLGNVITDGLYAFADRAQPVSCWCLKADYAESSGTHNTGIARLWNQVMTNAQVNGEYVLRTAAQKAAIAASYPYNVRTTVDGFPVNVFYRLTVDSELVYIGKYNFNNDKSTESVFGFRDIPGFDNSRTQCWEVLNNGNHLALFQDMDNFDTEWDQAYEARYPNGNTNTADLKAFSSWVVSTKGDVGKFKTEKWQHLDVYKVAAYYIYLMRFGAVDQVVKNAMLTSEDGIHFFFINYDNDTINAERNDGLLIYHYDIDRQSIDTSFSALVYAYAGHDSTLWNNLEADEEFMRIVSEVDTALYMAGLSYEKVIDMFDNQQAGKWCERVYNQDAQYKYVGPYTDSGINNLFMLQGSRSAHRRWWLSHRFDLLDSKFVSGAYKAKSIEFKAANVPAGLEFSVTSGNNIFYGYGLNNVPVETGVRLAPGRSHTFTTKQVINVGDPVRVYSAVNVQELDIHNFIPYLSTLNIAEVYNDEVGTKLKKLVMGVNTGTDSRRNTSLSIISGLSQAKRLEYLDISGYQGITNIDLSTHAYMTTLRAYESGLTGLVLANGSPVTALELPDSMQALSFDSLPNLSAGFAIKNFGRNLTSIYIRNCPKFDSKTFVFNWNTNKLTEASRCSLTLEGIIWTNVDAVSLITLGNIGMLSLKGTVVLNSVTLEQLTLLKEIYGDSCTNPDNELFIKAPDGVYLTGPSEILEGDSAQYSASVFSDYYGRVEYCLVNGNSEVLSYNNATIDAETGLVTTVETGTSYDRTVLVRAKHIPTQGKAVRTDMNITIKAREYPSEVEITGPKKLISEGNFEYNLSVTYPSEITGNYITEWTLTGTAFEQGLVEIGTQNKEKCIINVLSAVTEIFSFSLTAKTKKAINDSQTATGSITIELFIPGVIMTKNSNKEAMAVCYAQGWTANENYMTETEASAVFDIGTAFKNCNMSSFDEFQYFTGLTTLPSAAFQKCRAIESITLPNLLKTIAQSGGSPFDNCYALKILIIPEGVTEIGPLADYCNELESIVLPSTLTSLRRVSHCAKLTSINIPEGVTNIPDLNYNSALTTIRIPASASGGYINDYMNLFEGCSNLVSIEVDEANTKFASIDGMLVYKDTLALMSYPEGKSTEVIIPESITKIHAAFYGNKTVTSIHLPDSAIYLGQNFCNGCTALTSINIPEGVKEIGSYSFKDCRSLTSIILPENMDTLGYDIFSGCSTLETAVLPISIKKDSEFGALFINCPLLKSPIAIPEGVISLSNSFYNCSVLPSVTLPSTLKYIQSNTFIGCAALTSINIPEGVKEIGISAFAGCRSLKSLYVMSSIAPKAGSITSNHSAFGDAPSGLYSFAGLNNHDKGTNMLYVPAGATGYDTGEWLDPLCNPEKCGFTISYTL